MKAMEVRGVKIGDKFVASIDSRTKIISTVVEFVKTVSMTTGEDTGQVFCIAEKNYLGQVMRFETPFSTVIRNKVK